MVISFREINKLAIPAILAGIAEPLISIADSAIIGRIGKLELGAVGIATSFFLLLVWGMSSMKSAISSLVALNYGRGDVARVRSLIPQSIAISVLIGLVCFAATVPFSEAIFRFYKAEGEMLNVANDYFLIRAYGFPLTLATFSIFGVFRGYQNTYWAMVISLTGAGINILLDLWFVFGGFGLHAMGVKGAAWASVLSQLYMLLAALITLRWKLSRSYAFSLVPNPELPKLLAITGNLFLRTFALNISYYLGNRYATSYGHAHIAAHTIAMNIWLFSSFFIDGYANAGNALAGKIIGEGSKGVLYRTGIRLIKISVIIGVALGLVYAAGYWVMVDFFTPDDSVKVVFLTFFWLAIISQPVNGVAFALDGVFKGLGRAQLLRNTLFVGTFFIFAPVIWLCDYLDMGMIGVWTAFLCWMLFRGGSLFVIFRRDYAVE